MIVELSIPSYLTVLGLVQDALQVPSDASPQLEKLQKELTSATADQDNSAEISGHPSAAATLRSAGIMGR